MSVTATRDRLVSDILTIYEQRLVGMDDSQLEDEWWRQANHLHEEDEILDEDE